MAPVAPVLLADHHSGRGSTGGYPALLEQYVCQFPGLHLDETDRCFLRSGAAAVPVAGQSARRQRKVWISGGRQKNVERTDTVLQEEAVTMSTNSARQKWSDSDRGTLNRAGTGDVSPAEAELGAAQPAPAGDAEDSAAVLQAELVVSRLETYVVALQPRALAEMGGFGDRVGQRELEETLERDPEMGRVRKLTPVRRQDLRWRRSVVRPNMKSSKCPRRVPVFSRRSSRANCRSIK